MSAPRSMLSRNIDAVQPGSSARSAIVRVRSTNAGRGAKPSYWPADRRGAPRRKKASQRDRPRPAATIVADRRPHQGQVIPALAAMNTHFSPHFLQDRVASTGLEGERPENSLNRCRSSRCAPKQNPSSSPKVSIWRRRDARCGLRDRVVGRNHTHWPAEHMRTAEAKPATRRG